MKHLKKISIVLITIFSINSYACDVCGCGAGNSSSTQYSNYNYFGLSYNYMHFNYKEGIHSTSPIGTDNINSVQLTGQYFITGRLSINTMIPFQFNEREASTGTVQNHGLGDISLTGLFNLFHNDDNQSLRIGVGVKLPTGKFDLIRANANNASSISATQLGTGALDVIFPLQYAIQINDISFQANATYFYKTENKYYFKYGDQTQIQAKVSYLFKETTKASWSVSGGVSYDKFLNSKTSGSANFNTDGVMTNAIIGLKCELQKLAIGINYQTPIDQKLVNNDVTFNRGLGIYTHWKF
ncbi:transporter [Wenyingzhuangia fucanilytica]|uniref:transporter n=1 Tax=Wenyingzhuangia fucanilytica TaxID=1790137 RepID=UPI0012FB56A1|nr:transporter [Wenyingzhuangia fucanilytica]